MYSKERLNELADEMITLQNENREMEDHRAVSQVVLRAKDIKSNDYVFVAGRVLKLAKGKRTSKEEA